MNPRESIVNLARKTGLGTASTSKRLQSLISERLIRIATIIDTRALGFSTEAITFVKVKPGQITSVADSFVKDTRVYHISIIAGPFNLFLWSIFRDSAEMSHFLRYELGTMPGVIGHETMVQVGAPRLWWRPLLSQPKASGLDSDGVGLNNHQTSAET